MFSHHTDVCNLACSMTSLSTQVGKTNSKEMTNRTEEEGRPKDSTLSSYFSTYGGLKDLEAKYFFRENCVSEHFSVKCLFSNRKAGFLG